MDPKKATIVILLLHVYGCFIGLYDEIFNHSFQSICSYEIIHIENPIVSIVFQCHLQISLLTLNFAVNSFKKYIA